MRRDVEAGDDDVLLVYFAGASGNINLTPPNDSARKYNGYADVAQALAKVTLEVIKDENLTSIQAGKITVKKEVYKAETKKETAEEIEAARYRIANGIGSYLSLRGDEFIVDRNRYKSIDLRISALSFGELAFITAPYEMFDTNGMEIKEASPFKMTFILTNSDGAWVYMPSYKAATEYGGYDARATYFADGVAERLVAEYLRMLGEVKETN